MAATDTNFVPFADAELMAARITPDVFRGNENKTTTRIISSSFTLKDKNDNPALYVFNYDNNEGFVIMSADYRFEPICAFGDEGNIVSTGEVPSAFIAWFATTIEMIEVIRDGGLTEGVPGNQIQWMKLGGFLNLEHLPIGVGRVTGRFAEVDCSPWNFYNVDELLDNTWGQKCGYNNLIPETCTQDGYCGRQPTGCVPTAGAMIAHYWAVPSTAYNYNYSAMHRHQGDSGVQRLMLNVGQIVNMDYDCNDGSAAETSDISHFYQTYLYYSSPGDYDDYENVSRWVIKGDIDAGRPVILDGCTDDGGLFGWGSHGICHAWICDGYRLTVNGCYAGRFHFHMNWGWSGYGNGYFFQAAEWPVDGVFQYGRSILHNIHP